jgi:hypothetical protein
MRMPTLLVALAATLLTAVAAVAGPQTAVEPGVTHAQFDVCAGPDCRYRDYREYRYDRDRDYGYDRGRDYGLRSRPKL